MSSMPGLRSMHCLTASAQEQIFVVDDSGRVVGKIARGDVVAPEARFGPLEISTATDFIRNM